MIRLVTMNNPRVAQSFIDYMASRKIAIRMLPEDDGRVILLLEDGLHKDEVDAELATFMKNPNHERYQAASWELADTPKTSFKYNTPSILAMIKAKAGVATLSMMAICCIVYILVKTGNGNDIISALHFPVHVNQKWQLWRWVTHSLVHVSLTGLLFALLWWWQFGGDIEKKRGTSKLLQLTLVSSALTGAVQYQFGDNHLIFGLWGVIYSLLGYLWVVGWKAPQYKLGLPNVLVGFMLVLLFIDFMMPSVFLSGIANLTGLVIGLAFGLVEQSDEGQ